MSGVEILANATWTALERLPLHAGRGIDFVMIVLLGLVPLSVVFLRPLVLLVVCLGAAALFLIAAQIAFNAGLIVSIVYPLLSLVLSSVALLGAQAVQRGVAGGRVSR